jgi:hypothetical protein
MARLKNGSAFGAFEEAPIAFQPSYKWRLDKVEPDFSHRVPAYCDRILYRATLTARAAQEASVRGAAQLSFVHYEVMPDMIGSDHRPVRAVVHIPPEAWQLRPYRPMEGSGGRRLVVDKPHKHPVRVVEN